MDKKVSIILVNYNTTNDAIECIKSLWYIDYRNYEVIIVDNASRVTEVDKLKNNIKNNDKCKLILSNENNGFAGGNNIGIKYALDNEADYVLLLNCDTEVKEDFLSKLIYEVENDNENVGIAEGKINYYNSKNLIWFAGGQIDWNKYAGNHFGEGELDSEKYNEKKYINFATGCAMLIKREVFDKIGLLPEEYFMYYEDVDFCANAVQNGFKILYVPSSVIYHKVGAAGGGEASPFTLKWSNRGRLIFMNKYKYNTTKFKYNIIKFKYYITRFIKIILLLIKGESAKAKAIFEGVREGRKYISNFNKR